MKSSRALFPWRVFRRVILVQSAVVVIALGGFALATRYYFKREFFHAGIPPETVNEIFSIFDRILVFSLTILAFVLSLFAVWSGSALLFPLGRLLLKARGVSPHDHQARRDDPFGVYGEWSALENSIENIRKDLKAKTESLSLEREQSATLMSAISDAILALDLEETPLFYNSRFALLMGRENLNREKIKLWELFRDPEMLSTFRMALREGKAATLKAAAFDEVTLGRPGEKKYYSLSVSPLRRADGAVYGAVGIFHDVTDLKVAEQMRIDFVANVSHELRTPLTAIKGYADTMVQDTEEGRPIERDFLQVIVRNVDRLMNLIGDLLDLSSLDAGSEVLHKEKIDTEAFTQRILSQMKGTFEKKNHVVKVRCTVPAVKADLRRLEQVLVNLLDNANKYTPAGGQLEIVWEIKSKGLGAGDVLLRVIDSGPGIKPEHHQRLFERFYRVDKARSREMGGTGLGLAIVKHIMQRHGGSVYVKSEVGKGSQFICQFPA